MKNSPIKNINTRDYGESPYQSIINSHSQAGRHSRSPARMTDAAYNSSTDEYWRNRSKSLQAQVLALNEEIMFQARRIQKIDELEQKIQVLLAQNSHLVDENQTLIRLIQQKKSEVEMWKSRFEGESNHTNVAEAEKKKIFDHLNIKDQQHQVQVDKLLSEISRLHDQMESLEHLKQIEISQLKNRYENEAMNQIQNLKRSQYGNTEIQELNIKKLKDMIEEKQFEIENLKRQANLDNQRLSGEISYLKNEIKKIESQKAHELDLIKTQNQNTKNNLARANKKNQQELRNLHEAKVKRLSYELEQKKSEIQDLHSKVRRGGKENQSELSNIFSEKQKLRIQIKENDSRNKSRLQELTKFYEKQLAQTQSNNEDKQKSLIAYYEADIASLKEVITAKQQQIERLLKLNKEVKENEEGRLADIKANNLELKAKISEVIMHYERQIELMKIKISQLYEADLESLRSKLRNCLAANNRQTQNLRNMLDELRKKLADTVQQKIDLMVDYENRLNEFKVIHERDVQMMRDQVAMHEKNYENQTSKASLTHISHNNMVQQQNFSSKQIMTEKRNLQKQISNKNKQIETLNLRIQKLEGFHKHQVQKLEQEINTLKNTHQDWLDKQTKQSQDWNHERSQLKERNHELDLKLKRQIDTSEQTEQKLKKQVEKKGLQNAELRGVIHEMESKVGVLHGDIKVAAEGAEKTRMQHETHLNTQKDKYVETKDADRSLRTKQHTRVQDTLQKQIDELRRENQLLRQKDHHSEIREKDLKSEIGTLLDSVNKRSQLEEHVINIGLSNNYFKNIAEIFKKQLAE